MGTLSLRVMDLHNYNQIDSDSLMVSYSTDEGITWEEVGSTPAILQGQGSNFYTFVINQSGNVRIKITKNNINNPFVEVDDIIITSYGLPNALLPYQSFSPMGSFINPSYDELKFTFADTVSITSQSGYIRVYDNNTNTLIDSFTPSQGIISGNQMTFPITLSNNTSYDVSVDSGLFEVGNSITNGVGLGTWHFSTYDTLPLPYLTSLLENFSGSCNDDLNILGHFRQYSVHGNAIWQCSMDGYDDYSAVSMISNGVSDSSYANEDWLISRTKFDLSSKNSPGVFVRFKFPRYPYTGYSPTLTYIKVSSDYDGMSNPADSNFTWHNVGIVMFYDVAIYDSWVANDNISLNNYKNTPFYLAFTYKTDTAGGNFGVIYDNIIVNNMAISANKVQYSNVALAILGAASQHDIPLEINTKNAESVVITVYDIAGRVLYTTNANLPGGKNVINLDANIQAAGMYMINVANANLNGTVKTFVQ